MNPTGFATPGLDPALKHSFSEFVSFKPKPVPHSPFKIFTHKKNPAVLSQCWPQHPRIKMFLIRKWAHMTHMKLNNVGMLMWFLSYGSTPPYLCAAKRERQHFALALVLCGLVYMMAERGSCGSLYTVTWVLCCVVMIELCCVHKQTLCFFSSFNGPTPHILCAARHRQDAP